MAREAQGPHGHWEIQLATSTSELLCFYFKSPEFFTGLEYRGSEVPSWLILATLATQAAQLRINSGIELPQEDLELGSIVNWIVIQAQPFMAAQTGRIKVMTVRTQLI